MNLMVLAMARPFLVVTPVHLRTPFPYILMVGKRVVSVSLECFPCFSHALACID